MLSPTTFLAINQARNGRSVISIVQLFLVGLLHAVTSYALPYHISLIQVEAEPAKPASDPGKWVFLGTAIALVLFGGAFAGLTIALMGQDEVYLQVISTSGEGKEKKNATKVLKLLHRGKHWVLVTLLVGNVITNETLPIVLDRSIGGGYAAAISSTVLVIIFGEIVPQSICVRFGLPIGAVCSPFVLLLMWIFAPITWPIAKLLDYLLGEDHGTTYKKAGLKTLVDLHKTMGTAPGERLNEDEVAIISGVLDLKAKAVGTIMTPMEDVFTLSADATLDEDMIEEIMREGYSRIPIHDPSNKGDFVGMLLVKMLITYDPEDARKVNEFALATLPETRPDTSCLDIINFFQEGKSHMVLVSDAPGKSYGALGVVTLEDVIEELIGEEIIDESDVFVDVHKAIRRLQPAPTHRHQRAAKGQFYADGNSQAIGDESQFDGAHSHGRGDESETEQKIASGKRGSTASMERTATFLVRRPSNMSADGTNRPTQMRSNTAGVRSQLGRLGPSNAASKPRQTKINSVMVKPGVGTIPENKDAVKQLEQAKNQPDAPTSSERPIKTPEPTHAQDGIGQDMMSPGGDAKDAVLALHEGYGTLNGGSPSNDNSRSQERPENQDDQRTGAAAFQRPEKLVLERSNSHSTIGSMHSQDSRKKPRRHTARSGSITENIIESHGRKKMVLEPSSSSDEENGVGLQAESSKGSAWNSKNQSRSRGPSHQGRKKDQAHANDQSQASEAGNDGSGANGKPKKKRRPHRAKKKTGKDGSSAGGDENTPLLGRE